MGAGLIATAGGIDTHSFVCPQQIDHALFSGITTMLAVVPIPPMVQQPPHVTPGAWY